MKGQVGLRRFFRLFLYLLFAFGTVVMAGSLSPERVVRQSEPHQAGEVILQMTPELPQDRREAWEKAAEQDPVTLFRLCRSAR